MTSARRNLARERAALSETQMVRIREAADRKPGNLVWPRT
jgi:hypothetical protein